MVSDTPNFTEHSETTKSDSIKSNDPSVAGIEKTSAANVDTNINDIHFYYSAGDFHFILERGFKSETLKNAELVNVPFMPEWHAGIISIHGNIMPVIDMLSFAKTQNINVKPTDQGKHYLLKLEHPEYRPIVIKLDALPQTINIQTFKEVKTKNTPAPWIRKSFTADAKTLAFIDHKKLFEQLINLQ